MININEHSRIIGDFLEINADILYMQQTSRYPKILAKIIAKWNHKKLVKTINKLRKNNIVLNKDNLFELFVYFYNNFPPNGKYKSVNKVVYINEDENNRIVEAIIKFDNIIATLSIEGSVPMFEINILDKRKESNKQYSITLDKMYTTNKKTEEIVSAINTRLVDDLVSFLLSIINNYTF